MAVQHASNAAAQSETPRAGRRRLPPELSILGVMIGAVILGVLTSGFTFLNVDAHYQEIIKGAVIIAAVVTDQYRQRKRCKA